MCTMTWFVTDTGYELFFNRDERTSRRRADLPSLQTKDGVQYISPTDADAGGTWIALNDHGVSVSLLNHYQFEQIETYKPWISRGEIVRQFAPTIAIDGVEEQFHKLELDDYRAFRMFIIDRYGDNRLCVWDGHQPRVEHNVRRPKSSSSVDAKHVKQIRRNLFENLGLAQSQHSEDYLRFHASHLPTKSKESVCMHRDDANTVSMSHLVVAGDFASFRYADGSPCEAVLGPATTLDLVEPICELQRARVLAAASA